MIMHSDCPFHLFPHVVGNRSCLVLLCHVQREAWVEVSTKSRPKFSQRKVNNNYAKHKTLVFRTQTAPLGDPQHAFSTLFRAFSESVWTCLLISTCVDESLENPQHNEWMPLMLHAADLATFVGVPNFAVGGGKGLPFSQKLSYPLCWLGAHFIWQSLGTGVTEASGLLQDARKP